MRSWVLSIGLLSILLSAELPSISFDMNNSIWLSDQYLDVWGIRKKMGEKGIYLLPSYINDLDWPVSGGIQTTHYPLFLYLFSLEMGLDLKKLVGCPNTSAYLNFLVHGGKNPSGGFVGDFEGYVGDYQGFDNIEAYSLVQLAELWMQQQWFDHRLALRFGKIDLYGMFMESPFAQTLMNNSYSQFPTVLSYPTYPNPSVGVVLMAKPFKYLKLLSAVFDGSNAQGVNTGNLGAKRFFQNLGKHLLLLNEIDWFWGDERFGGKGILGLWAFNGKLATFDDQTMGKAAGPYFALSQTLWREKQSTSAQKLSNMGGFVQTGYTNRQIADTPYYVGGGLTYNQLVKKLYSDSLSLGASTIFFSKAQGSTYTENFETSLECTYQMFVCPYFSIQPDIQWIIHPGGVQGRRNALVVSLRIFACI